MDEIIARITSSVGIGEDQAKQGVGMLLNFLMKDGDAGVVGQLIEKIPGASDLLAAHSADEGGGGGLGGMMSAMGGGGGLMGLAGQLQGIGLDMGEIQGLAKQFAEGAKEIAGEDAVNAVAATVPGLEQFM